MNVLEALRDPNIFGSLGAFRDLRTWRAWIVFLKVVYGLPLDDDELGIFQVRTGRIAPRPGGYSEAVCIVGRQSGKSQIAAMIADFEAACAIGARGLYAVLVAQDARAAIRTLFGYAVEPFDASPMLQNLVVARTAESLTLTNGLTIVAYPCRPQSVRGLRARVVVVDEVAHFIATDGRPTDIEMLRALRPTLAMTGGKLIILSSPYAASGALYDLHRRHFSKDSSTLVWTASAPDMPTRGVFAEGKLGHCNVSEEIDNTKFWKWEEHPIPIEAPGINPVTPIQPTPQQVSAMPTAFPQSLVNIVNPSPAPDPTGLTAALSLLGTPNIFRDMHCSTSIPTSPMRSPASGWRPRSSR